MTDGQVRIHPRFGGLQPQLLEARSLPLGEAFIRKVGEGRPAPQAEGLGECHAGSRRVAGFRRPPSLIHQAFET